MRLGTASGSGFVAEAGARIGAARAAYRAALSGIVRPVKTKVMLGDSTVAEQGTFDPGAVAAYYGRVAAGLAADGWSVRDAETTRSDDVRRTFSKFEAAEGRYVLSGHMSVQFRALLYYRPDYRVVECLRELDEIAGSESGDAAAAAAAAADGMVASHLRGAGLGAAAGAPGEEGALAAFEALYNDDSLLERAAEAAAGADAGRRRAAERKAALLGELDGLLVETYSTTDVMIDEARLVTGEEGLLLSLDLEMARGPAREASFDARRIPAAARAALLGRLGRLAGIMGEAAGGPPPAKPSQI